MDVPGLIAALRDPRVHPRHVEGEVEVVQTHISVLFMTQDRVYKIKKAVDLGFLDYSTPEARRRFCAEEVRLNRRLAPSVYLGVAEIRRDETGVIRIEGPGETVEWAVEMVRLPHRRMLDAMLERSEIDNELLDGIVERIVLFHRECATGEGVDEHATAPALRRQVEENFRELRAIEAAAADPTLSTVTSRFLQEVALRFVADHEQELERRVREGRTREGHGDLHAGNICLTDDGPVMYDCIEFSQRLRCRDVAAEMAFLAMDLDARCFRGFARYLIHRYAELARDEALPTLVPFYKLHFAVVRAKVALIRAGGADADGADRDAARREAQRYFHLAASYVLPPSLILTCGLPGVGKSWAARAIAQPFEAVVLRSDVVRKERAGVAPTTRLDGGDREGLYDEAETARTYDELCRRAGAHLEAGRTVVVDATFAAAARRRPFVELAERLARPVLLVEITAAAATVRRRLEERARSGDAVSDANWGVHEWARARFEPPAELTPSRRLRLDGERTEAEIVSAVIDRLIDIERDGGG